MGTLNRTGVPYAGSFDIWIRNRISHLLDTLFQKFRVLPASFGPGGWVNGNNYVRSTEVFGILPLSDQFRASLSMLPHHPQFAKDQHIRHGYLAAHQNTRVAVLPIHTTAERALFKALLADSEGLFSGRKEPNWIELAKKWNGHGDGVNIFYKVSVKWITCGCH